MTSGGVAPFLRWAGGKSWLVRRADELLGTLAFDRYHEPFLGGGAFFFGLGSTATAFLSDANVELIETYQAVKEDVERVIVVMAGFANDARMYYDIRSTIPTCRFERAARFIYLNQTSYNGIYRVNLKGVYNVPFGGRSKPFLDAPTLRRAAIALNSAQLTAADFDASLDNILAGDFVFIDPPYTVSHNFNGFIKYNQALFSLDDQHRLARYVDQVRAKGAKYLLTNAAHAAIKDIFASDDHLIELTRASLIGGRKAKRGHVSEYIFTNLEIADHGDLERGQLSGSHGGSRRSADIDQNESQEV